MLVPLVLGDFVFDETQFEVPDILGDLAGYHVVQQNDFPGGIRTHQAFGYFPAPIRWRARFFGPNASTRTEQVKRILYAGKEIDLRYGERAWTGRLVKFSPSVRTTWWFEYDAEFWPRLDISSGQGEFPSPEGLAAIMDLHALALADMALHPGSLFSYISASVLAPINTLLNAINGAMSLFSGVVEAFDNTARFAIRGAAGGLFAATLAYQNSADPRESSPAWDVASRSLIIKAIVSANEAPKWLVPSINPNLMGLAAQYYGDPTQWRRIAEYNGLSDPQPIGVHHILVPPP